MSSLAFKAVAKSLQLALPWKFCFLFFQFVFFFPSLSLIAKEFTRHRACNTIVFLRIICREHNTIQHFCFIDSTPLFMSVREKNMLKYRENMIQTQL